MANNDEEKTKIPSQNLFPVVGIGASAGGLEAFKKLLTAIPEDSGMAYILVQHLHPEHDSALTEILQRCTRIPVEEIRDNVEVLPDHIYVIPSNKTLVATDGILQLSPRPTKDKQHLSIDIFFTSLAEVHRDHSIGVVLSGTGADGTVGLKDIKDHGGLSFAQDPLTAAYKDMPQHAIDANVVDFILAPELIPGRLVSIQRSFTGPGEGMDKTASEKLNSAFRRIITLLKVRVGVDFSLYKQPTVRRRILRRMVMLQINELTEYEDYIKKDKAELDKLFDDLLIPVTFFFRDEATFDALCEVIFPDIIKDKSLTNPLRIWVAGCSTGQEAYSMAICLHEYLGDRIQDVKIQIFATDISEASIKKARSGTYSKKETEAVSDKRLGLFFQKTNGDYRVKKEVRDMCVFAVHNFLKDPPFANLHLVSCRNVLIYLEPFLQKKAFNMFHYALNDKGVLLLGKSETTGSSSELFIPIGKKDKFYTRKPAPGKFKSLFMEPGEPAHTRSRSLNHAEKTTDFQKAADEVLLAKFTPIGVVVNDALDIVQFRGHTGEFLEPSPGKASLNVLKMAKEGLGFEIRNCLQKTKSGRGPFIREGLQLRGRAAPVSIEVVPLLNTLDPYFLILFRDTLPVVDKNGAMPDPNAESSFRIQQLEKELLQLREDMRNISEEQEAANEELQSSNEELLSGSEELQSLNEELETSKEELQSTNEELVTVNQELYDRNDAVNQSRHFAEMVISMLHEPLLVLDATCRIKSVNEAFLKIFDIEETAARGQILYQLHDKAWDVPVLKEEFCAMIARHDLQREKEITIELPGVGTRTICMNMRPVHRDSGEELYLLALDDITVRKNNEAQKDEFISIASHELKTPLTSAKGFLQLLEMTISEEDETARLYVQKAIHSIGRLNELIAELLDVSKIKNGKLNFTRRDFDFDELIKDTIESIRFSSPNHTIIPAGKAGMISGDQNRLQQVLINLLTNAVKYSPAGGKVSVRALRENGSITVSVKDTGIGIPADDLEKVFQKYHRAEAHSSAFQGLGIGLFISHEIIERHKGILWAESEQGKGSVFSFTLPYAV